MSQYAQRRFHPKSKAVLSYGPNLNVTGILDHRNVQQNWSVQPGFNLEMPRSTYFNVWREEAFERFDNINFRGVNNHFGGHTEYFKKATFDWTDFNKGRAHQLQSAGWRAPFICNGSELELQITVRPTSRVKVDTTYYLTRLRTRFDSFPGVPKTSDSRPGAVFVNHLARTRLNYQFTRSLSLRLIVDYNGVLQNPSLVALDRQKAINGDALLTYLVDPGTALYIGYSGPSRKPGAVSRPPSYLGRTAFPSVTTARQFFVKLSYLYRM